MIDISIADYDLLVHRIYNAGINPGEWSVFVDDLANVLGGSIVCLHVQDAVANGNLGLLSFKTNQYFLQSYGTYYASLNVLSQPILSAPVRKVIYTDEIYARDEFLKMKFYNDYLRTQDVTSALAVALHQSPDRCVYLSGNIRDKNAEQVRSPMQKLFELLGPHISRSIELMRAIPRSVDGEDYRATAEHAPDAVFLIDQAGRLVYENRSAGALRSAVAFARIDGGGAFHLLDRQAEAALQAALGAITRQDYARMLGDITIRGVDGFSRRATVAPLPRTAETMFFDQAFADRPAAMLVVHNPPAGAAEAAPFAGYGLTQAELALALSITHGQSPQEYAESRGISIHTARTQLKLVFAKTGVNRQSQLAALARASGAKRR